MLIKFNFSILIVLLLINLLFSNCILEQSQNINEHDNDIISNQSPSSLQQKSDILLETFEKGINSVFNYIMMKQLDIPSYTTTSIFNFIPGYTYLLEPKCESITMSCSINNYPIITYSKCSVLVIMDTVRIENPSKVVATLDNYLTELYYEKIEISLQNKLIIFNSFSDIEYKYLFNENESLFDNSHMRSDFISRMKNLGKILHQKFNEEINYYTIDFHLESFLRGVFNILYKNGPFVDVDIKPGEDTSNKVTHISYEKPKLEDIVITKKILFLSKLIVYFEYAINFDINCNEGYFVLNHVEFNSQVLSYSKDSVIFEPLNLSETVKTFIMELFEKEFLAAIKEFKGLGN